MFNKKQLYLIGALALVLSLALVQVQVKAVWEHPTDGPGGATANLPLTNPLTADLDLGAKSLTNGASATFTSGSFTSLDLRSGDLTNVGKINGFTPGSGGITNKLISDLSGESQYAITNLKGCDPAKEQTCGAVEGQAGKSAFSNSFAVGLYGRTQAISGDNPTYGVYGLADSSNNKGVGVTGVGQTGVFGYSSASTGYGGFFQNDGLGVALGFKGAVMGDLDDFSLEVRNGNFTFEATKPAQQFEVIATSYFTGTTHLQNTLVDGSLQLVDSGDGIGIVGDNDSVAGLAGVTGMGGEIGIFGSGPIGVYGEGNYGAIFAGDRMVGWSDPTPGGTNTLPPADNDPITLLFGINQSIAALNTPGYIGLVATGGYQYAGGTFTNAGLGLCAVSGELTHDDVSDSDYFNYCKDGYGKNNFAGFFAGNIYVKDGSIQLNDTLAAAGENLIYGNIDNASFAGSSLIKLQTGGVDKFKVDKDGATTFSNLVLNKTLGTNESLIFSNLNTLTSGNLLDLQVGGSSKFKVTRDGITTIGSSLISPAILFLNGAGSYINFDGTGSLWPICNASNDGVLFYGKTNHVLCSCNGTSWQPLDDDYLPAACTNTVSAPQPLH